MPSHCSHNQHIHTAVNKHKVKMTLLRVWLENVLHQFVGVQRRTKIGHRECPESGFNITHKHRMVLRDLVEACTGFGGIRLARLQDVLAAIVNRRIRWYFDFEGAEIAMFPVITPQGEVGRHC